MREEKGRAGARPWKRWGSVLNDADLDPLVLVLGLSEVHGHPVAEVLVDLDDGGLGSDGDLPDGHVPDPGVADDEVRQADLAEAVLLSEVDLEPAHAEDVGDLVVVHDPLDGVLGAGLGLGDVPLLDLHAGAHLELPDQVLLLGRPCRSFRCGGCRCRCRRACRS